MPYAAVTDTHSAVVFFAGDRAYKLKKPVALGFLDFSAPEAGAAACRREVELNRPFSPDVCQGVAEIRGPDGRVCDHLVVMRRMPAGALWARWKASIGQLRGSAGRFPETVALDEVDRLARRFVTGRRCSMTGSAAGTLWMATVICSPTASSAWMMGCILDCLEFDDRLRQLDGLDDAAFLSMDLGRPGAPDTAEQFTRWYAEYSADPAPLRCATSTRPTGPSD